MHFCSFFAHQAQKNPPLHFYFLQWHFVETFLRHRPFFWKIWAGEKIVATPEKKRSSFLFDNAMTHRDRRYSIDGRFAIIVKNGNWSGY